MPGTEPIEITLTYMQACQGNSGTPTGNPQSNLELNVQWLCNFGFYLQKNRRIQFCLFVQLFSTTQRTQFIIHWTKH